MRYRCPKCQKPYMPVQGNRFPVHGKRWVPGSVALGTHGTWQWCDGVREVITTATETYQPRPAKRRH